MFLFLSSLAILLLGGLSALMTGRSARLSNALGVGGAVLGCSTGLISAVYALFSGGFNTLTLRWDVPFGSFSLGIDALSAFFLIPVFLLPGVAAVYGGEYMRPWLGRKPLGAHWFFYSLLVVGMAMVVAARDGLLFLIAWEVMSLAPFFLVTFEDEKENVRQAGWTYLVAAHLGAVPLLALFIALGGTTGSLAFGSFMGAVPATAGVIFLLAVVGFGTKAGFIPLHVWLPEAHPAAPSHVSAVMSGVMIKTGIYGLMRVLTFLGHPPAWWGVTLISIGLVSGVAGVLFAISQHDLKRLLAYSSVENIGIISLGLGLGLTGQHLDNTFLTVVGYSGALLHVLNHSMFKGLLFLGAGSVLHSAGTVNMERLGGLGKSMPKASAAFLVGAAAISGLPPLNGFVSELMVYIGGVSAGVQMKTELAVAAWCAVGGLALIGGLAAVCFAKAFGSVFLGEPRRAEIAERAHEPKAAMLAPMWVLAALCIMTGLLAPLALKMAVPAVASASGLAWPPFEAALAVPLKALSWYSAFALLLFVLIGSFVWLRHRLLKAREVTAGPTWDCGYARPTARMQYTASSFTEPITSLAGGILGQKAKVDAPSGLFSVSGSYSSGTPGGAREYIYKPVFKGVASGLSRFRWLQHGKTHLYVLYIAATLVILLIWKL